MIFGGIGLLLLAGFVVWKVEPAWWSEVVLVITVWLANLLIWRWITGFKKWGWLIATILTGLLLLNRFDLLNGITIGITLIIAGLISLIN